MVLQLHVSFTWLDNTKTANICLYKKEKNKAEHHKYKQNFKNVFNRDFEYFFFQEYWSYFEL